MGKDYFSTKIGRSLKILIIADYYYPGYKAGGPIQSVYNLVCGIEKHYEIFVVTRDRDSGDMQAYTSITPSSWNTVSKHQVYYLSKGEYTRRFITSLLADMQPEVIHLNSFFSPFTVKLFLALKDMVYRPKATLMSVRGEFGPAALSNKALKKKAYLLYFKKFIASKLDILYVATNEDEKSFIKSAISDKVNISVCANVGKQRQEKFCVSISGNDTVRFVSIARLTPIKNLLFFVEVLSKLETSKNIEWDIYGRKGSDSNLEEIQEYISETPNVQVLHKGTMPNSQILKTVAPYDVFVLPTLGENFGQAIYDAFLAGVPALISDKTPWQNLEKKNAGWSLPLDLDLWVNKTSHVINLDIDQRNRLKQHTYKYGQQLIASDRTIKKYLGIVEKAIYN